MFDMTEQQVRITHINTRTEMHGDEEKLAADVKMAASVSNLFLDELAQNLRPALYKQASGELDLDPGMPHLSELKYPLISSPFGWKGEAKKATYTIHAGRKPMVFEADINKLTLDPENGGTVKITFRAQIYPDPETVGKITAFLGHDVKISVERNTEDSHGDDDNGGNDGGGE